MAGLSRPPMICFAWRISFSPKAVSSRWWRARSRCKRCFEAASDYALDDRTGPSARTLRRRPARRRGKVLRVAGSEGRVVELEQRLLETQEALRAAEAKLASIAPSDSDHGSSGGGQPLRERLFAQLVQHSGDILSVIGP